MITSIATVYSDLFELGSQDCTWEGVTLETLLEEFGIDYTDTYKGLRDLAIYRGEAALWVRFTHDLHVITLHEFHRWEDRPSGLTVVHQYRIRAQEDIHE